MQSTLRTFLQRKLNNGERISSFHFQGIIKGCDVSEKLITSLILSEFEECSDEYYRALYELNDYTNRLYSMTQLSSKFMFGDENTELLDRFNEHMGHIKDNDNPSQTDLESLLVIISEIRDIATLVVEIIQEYS